MFRSPAQQDPADATQGALRLTPDDAPPDTVGRLDPSAAVTYPLPGRTPAPAVPITGPGDPRWVLAARVADKLEGTLLRPEHRERLIRLGRMLGLTPFDANLVIAIVQDQARRGHAPPACPAAAQQQLELITPPQRTTLWRRITSSRAMTIALILATLLLAEIILLSWLF